MISTSNSSIRVPSKTVRPTPFMPGPDLVERQDLDGGGAAGTEDGRDARADERDSDAWTYRPWSY